MPAGRRVWPRPNSLQAIYEAIQQCKVCQESEDTPGFLHASRDFHRYLGEAAGNLPLTNFIVGNEERTDMYLLNTNKTVDGERMAASLREHEAIFEALVQSDPEAASRCVIYHARSLRERFADLFVAQADENGESGK